MERKPERRSDETRARILKAARRRFGADGYDRTTIRAVAADAAIHPSMVMRYYGNKESLFAAAVEFDLRLPPLEEIPAAEAGEALVRHFLNRWEGDPADQTLAILLRASATNAAAVQRMHDIFARQLAPAFAAICPGDDIIKRAALVATQMLGLAYCRYVLRLPAVTNMAAEELMRSIGPTIQRYLTAPLQEGQAERI